MSIQPHSLGSTLGSTENYWTELGDHFKKVEGFTSSKGAVVYPDSLGVPTFGMGYALIVKNRSGGCRGRL